jgi:hypothetical protein
LAAGRPASDNFGGFFDGCTMGNCSVGFIVFALAALIKTFLPIFYAIKANSALL